MKKEQLQHGEIYFVHNGHEWIFRFKELRGDEMHGYGWVTLYDNYSSHGGYVDYNDSLRPATPAEIEGYLRLVGGRETYEPIEFNIFN
jgi:hypothetical protein